MGNDRRKAAVLTTQGVFPKVAYPKLRSLVVGRNICLVIVPLVVLIATEGHLFDIPALYGLVGDAKSSVPTLTAAVLALVATSLQRPLGKAGAWELGLWIAVIFVSGLSRAAYAAGWSLGPGEMGWNTAASFTFIALSQIAYRRWKHDCAFLFVGLVVPFASLFGYLTGVLPFAGQMSVFSAIILTALGIANSLRFARRKPMRPLVLGTPVGQVIRALLMFWALAIVAQAIVVRAVPLQFLHAADVALLLVNAIATFMAIVFLGSKIDQTATRQRQIERRLYEAALRDPLTAAHSRAAAEFYFQTFAQRGSVGLALFDIDHFKVINDFHGHEVGDKVLKNLSSAIRSHLRAEEILVRWGGEEFLLLTRGQDCNALTERAEDLRGIVASMSKASMGLPPVTISVGVAMARRGDIGLGPAVARADNAMFEAKRSGRNRVVLAQNAAA